MFFKNSSFFDAQDLCKKYDAYLTSVESIEEYQFLQSLSFFKLKF